MDKNVLKIAHRGYSAKYKDNTMESFQKAYENNFDMIEMDIQLCKNNTIIIFHDTYYDDKYIRDLTLDEIKSKDKDIMTLQYFFENFDYKKIKIYLDLKGSNNLVYYLVKFLVKNDIDICNIYFGSFNIKHLDYLYNVNPNFNLGVITYNNFTHRNLNYLIKKYNLAFVCIDWSVLDRETISYLHKLNTRIFACTANAKNIHFIRRYNIDGIVSDIIL